MAELQLAIGGHIYTLSCADDEQEALVELGAKVAEQVQVARQIAPGITEVRQLLFASIFLAEKLEVEIAGHRETLAKLADMASSAPPVDAEPIDAATLDSLSERLEAISQRVARLTSAV